MNNFIKIFVCAIISAASCTAICAQPSRSNRVNSRERITREQLAEVQAKHIAHELAFSDDVTTKFISTYCDCQKEIWTMAPRQRLNKQATTEQENKTKIERQFAVSEKVLEIRQKYYKIYSTFLTQAQIARVYELEKKMMRRISHNAGSQHRNPQTQK